MNDDTRLCDGVAPREGSQGLAVALAGGSVASPGQSSGVYAALDLGTNNCRLLIACPTGDGFRVIELVLTDHPVGRRSFRDRPDQPSRDRARRRRLEHLP